MAVSSQEDIVSNIVVVEMLERAVSVGRITLFQPVSMSCTASDFKNVQLTFQLSPFQPNDSLIREKMIWSPTTRQVAPRSDDAVSWL